ncbi:MAG: hypothetical protein KAS66_04105 [Candidatus Omnitrophica bacterium]|nr:hypothetical protein [Candidatus Omnitrophota bacterium]
MDENEPTVTLKLEDTIRTVLMLEDAIDVLISSIDMFTAQKDMCNKSDVYDTAEGKMALKRVDNGLEILKSKTMCRKFFLKDLKEVINETGIDIDAEVEKYKKRGR